MLSVHKILGGPSAASYYLDQVAQGREDYYTGEGEEAGRWVGAGALQLAWNGEVDGDDFISLIAGAGLRKPRVNGVAGFDLTLRAPKSVSVLWAIAPERVARELRAGHDAAVAEALSYLEREACRGRRGKDGVVQVRGGGFVGAAFVHRSSRAGDPLLHTHVVVGNLTQGPDGRWTALDGRHLYRHQKAAGVLYQAVLRRELTERLGLEWGPVKEGAADLAGVPCAVIEHFSQRRAEILEHMAAHGGRSAASAEIAALETRRAKENVPFARLRAEWAARAQEHGLSDEVVEGLFGAPRVPELRVPSGLTFELTERASTFGQAELLAVLAAAQPAGARVAELEAIARRVLSDPEIVALPPAAAKAGVVEPRYTTRELLRTEASLLETARPRRRSRVARVRPWTLTRQLRDQPTLTREQREVMRRLCGDGDGISIVRAAAGTGKTFMLDAAREVWTADDIVVVGCALSARAALELEDQAGIPSVTVAATKLSLQAGAALPSGGVLVVDEAGMVGTRDLAFLADAAREAGTKLVLVGDDRQLPEIDAGGAFHALAEQLGALELTEVRRQSEAWDRDALDALRNGDTERWARAYRDHGRITVADSARDARAALVNDWSRAEGEAVMIAGRRADVRDLNDRARQLLQQQGRLSLDELQVGCRAFAAGDRVVGTRNDRSRGILNGQRGTITEIDHDHQAAAVTLDGGRRITLDRGYLSEGHLDHAYALTAHRAQGATVDRAFVLGSEDLYQQLGYTALSRHRHEARFYVARPDFEPRHERDVPDQDPLIAGLKDLLSRSGAKQLAHDSLADRDTALLARERDELRERFAMDEDRPSARDVDYARRDRDRDDAQEALEETERRIARLQQQRDDTSPFAFGERRFLKELIADASQQLGRQVDRAERAVASHQRLAGRLTDWVARHGEQAAQLVATDRELTERDQVAGQAIARQQAVERAPKWPERQLPAPDLGRDIGIEID